MAEICSVLCMSHSPFLYATAEDWTSVRASRPARLYRSDFAPDTPQANAAKHARVTAAFAELRRSLRAARPDVLLIFGDDQREQFDFGNFPALSIFAGERFEGYRISPRAGIPPDSPPNPKDAANWATASGHPELARTLLTELVGRGFDIGFSLNLPKPERGIGHAFMRPAHYLTPDFDLPIVPFFINCFYGPQPTGARCHALGRAVREIIDAVPGALRIAVLGSGGLWHTPGLADSYIDGAFDRGILDAVEAGSAAAMAHHFDDSARRFIFENADAAREMSGGTAMVLGLGSGSGETRNWIAASATVDGMPGRIVDYIPINASPIGAAFACWDLG